MLPAALDAAFHVGTNGASLLALGSDGATGAAAPVPVPAVEKEVVVMTYQGLPFDPRWTRIQRDEAASKFRAIQHTTGMQTAVSGIKL